MAKFSGYHSIRGERLKIGSLKKYIVQEKFAETDRAIVDISNWEQDKEGRTTVRDFGSKINIFC